MYVCMYVKTIMGDNLGIYIMRIVVEYVIDTMPPFMDLDYFAHSNECKSIILQSMSNHLV